MRKYFIKVTFPFMPELPTYVKTVLPNDLRLTQNMLSAKEFTGYINSMLTLRCIALVMKYKYGHSAAKFELQPVD